MRYSYGVLLGTILSAIAFCGSAAIQLMGYGVTDDATLASLWNLFVIWSVFSFVLILSPPIFYYATRREQFKRVSALEFGSVFLFTPFWLIMSLEVTGVKSFESLLIQGIGGIPFTGPEGSIQQMYIAPWLSIPILIGLIILGLFFINPSFVESIGSPTPKKPKKPVETVALETKPDAKPDTIADDMPEISRPIPDEKSLDELKSLLLEMDVTESIINRIITAGFATVTDVIAAKPDHLAAAAGIDAREAEKLLLDLQKKVWFGGI